MTHYLRFLGGYPLCWNSPDQGSGYFGTYFMLERIDCSDCIKVMATW